jgi:hypothetical protein
MEAIEPSAAAHESDEQHARDVAERIERRRDQARRRRRRARTGSRADERIQRADQSAGGSITTKQTAARMAALAESGPTGYPT